MTRLTSGDAPTPIRCRAASAASSLVEHLDAVQVRRRGLHRLDRTAFGQVQHDRLTETGTDTLQRGEERGHELGRPGRAGSAQTLSVLHTLRSSECSTADANTSAVRRIAGDHPGTARAVQAHRRAGLRRDGARVRRPPRPNPVRRPAPGAGRRTGHGRRCAPVSRPVAPPRPAGRRSAVPAAARARRSPVPFRARPSRCGTRPCCRCAARRTRRRTRSAGPRTRSRRRRAVRAASSTDHPSWSTTSTIPLASGSSSRQAAQAGDHVAPHRVRRARGGSSNGRGERRRDVVFVGQRDRRERIVVGEQTGELVEERGDRARRRSVASSSNASAAAPSRRRRRSSRPPPGCGAARRSTARRRAGRPSDATSASPTTATDLRRTRAADRRQELERLTDRSSPSVIVTPRCRAPRSRHVGARRVDAAIGCEVSGMCCTADPTTAPERVRHIEMSERRAMTATDLYFRQLLSGP